MGTIAGPRSPTTQTRTLSGRGQAAAHRCEVSAALLLNKTHLRQRLSRVSLPAVAKRNAEVQPNHGNLGVHMLPCPSTHTLACSSVLLPAQCVIISTRASVCGPGRSRTAAHSLLAGNLPGVVMPPRRSIKASTCASVFPIDIDQADESFFWRSLILGLPTVIAFTAGSGLRAHAGSSPQ